MQVSRAFSSIRARAQKYCTYIHSLVPLSARNIRQGCNLSPLLFILSLSDIEEHMKVWGAKGILMSNLSVNRCHPQLMWVFMEN